MISKQNKLALNIFTILSLIAAFINCHTPQIYAQESIFVDKNEKFIFTHYIMVIVVGLIAVSFGFFIISKVLMRLRTQDKLKSIPAGSIKEKTFPYITLNYKLNNVLRLMQEHNLNSLFVLNRTDNLLGVVTKKNIDSFIKHKQEITNDKHGLITPANYTAQDVIDKTITACSQNDNLPNIMQTMNEENLNSICVMSADKRVLGIITRDKIFSVITELLTKK